MKGHIITYTKGFVYPLNPKPEEIRIEDIAHALSLMCRYNGHTPYMFSVAQHSLNVYDVLTEHKAPLNVRLIGLLHDASEAYIADICRPIKKNIAGYKSIEDVLMDTIIKSLTQYGLPDISSELNNIMEVISFYDAAMLAIEGETLFGTINDWDPVIKYYPRFNVNTDYVAPHVIEKLFVTTFYNLVEEIVQLS